MTCALPSPAIAFSPRIRKSPFFNSTRSYGCKAYSVYNHMYMPLYYESPEADFWALAERVTLWDVAVERQIEIAGADAAAFTQFMTPRNLSSCAVGQCKYVLLTADDGGIVNDPVLLKLAEDRFWLSIADSDVLLWARGLATAKGFDVEIRELDVSPLQLQGPRAGEVMRRLAGEATDGLKYFRFTRCAIDGIDVIVSRTGWSGEFGYEIYLFEPEHGDRLWETIMHAGRESGIAPGAPSTIRRIEAGMLSYGADMSLSENPFEIGFARLVDLEMEVDFCGREALQAIRENGVRRSLSGVEIEGDPLAANEHRWQVMAGGEPAGAVTSAVHSPRLRKNIALALLASEHAAHGTAIEVETPAGRRSGRVVPYPFFDPQKRLASA